MELELELQELIFSYQDDSGSFSNMPKRGQRMESPLGRIEVIESIPMSKYTDGGASASGMMILFWMKFCE